MKQNVSLNLSNFWLLRSVVHFKYELNAQRGEKKYRLGRNYALATRYDHFVVTE